MKEAPDEIYNGPKRSQPLTAGIIQQKKTGHFTLNQPKRVGGGSHVHKWIFGTDNAVCTKCGYTLAKTANLPNRGL
jgi:hypothetical protein